MQYDYYNQIKITDRSGDNITSMYSQGFVMTRLDKGIMNQVRSLRINLEKFELTSENRRILRKNQNLEYEVKKLPLRVEDYDWQIHKIGKKFYDTKFGDGIFSANKIKEILTTDHNFNILFQYILSATNFNKSNIGWCIAVSTEELVHYCFPFYRLDIDSRNIGMGMMLRAIIWAKEQGKTFFYLGSLPEDKENDASYKYKLQFRGLEVWKKDKQIWREIQI